MGINRLVYIKADGNSHIATGHLVRTLAIARACRSLGLAVIFLVSDEESHELLRSFFSDSTKKEFPVICSQIAYDHLEKELPFFQTIFTQTHPAAILVDSYFVTAHYFRELRALTQVIYLDDLMAFDYSVDLLINYDVIPDACLSRYQSAYQNAGKLLLGSSYTPLREQFQHTMAAGSLTIFAGTGNTSAQSVSSYTSANASPGCQLHILLTTGGSDSYDVLGKLLPILLERVKDTPSCPVIFHAVIGTLYTHLQELQALAATHPDILLHKNVSDMASLMSAMDLSISAAGTMLYELCAMGIPAISYTIADNQIPAATAFDQVQAIPYIGDIRTTPDLCSHLADQLFVLLADPAARKKQSALMHSLVDGNGAKRIASEILTLCKS